MPSVFNSLFLLSPWIVLHASALRAHELKVNSENGLAWTLSWHLVTDDERRGAVQTHFQVRLSSNALPDFDTGKIASQEPLTRIPSAAIAPHAVYAWQVKIWDEDHRASGWSDAHVFVTHPSTWMAPWISEQNAKRDAKTTLLRGHFSVQKLVTQAVVSVSGLGHYELTINSQRVGDHQLDAGWTKYTTTCLYSTYDVTALVRQGVNGIGAFLGNGMYNNVGTRYQKWTGSAGPRMLALQMTLRFTDGTTQVVSTDSSWQGKQGPITFNSIYGGEDYDARLELVDWDSPPFAGSTWVKASLHEGPGCSLKPQLQPPVKIREIIQAANIMDINGSKVIDFGTEFSGWPVLSFVGKAGVSVRMTPSERLAPDGLVAQNIGPAYWQYTLKGGGTEFWRPRFFTYGFRYLQVEIAIDLDPKRYRFIRAAVDVFLEDIENSAKYYVPSCSMCFNPCKTVASVTSEYLDKLRNGGEFYCSLVQTSPPPAFNISGEFVYTSAAITGNFSCSKPIFNRIHAMILGAMKSNLQSIFTDCPHRERLGWLEQSWLLQSSVAANFDVSSLYAKIVMDMAEAQLSDGMIPNIAPEYLIFWGGFRDSPEWGVAFIMLPMFLHDEYGEIDVLQRYYTNMSSYMSYLTRKANDGILTFGLGDWLAVGDKSPRGVTATMVYYEALQVMIRAAKLFGKSEDEDYFKLLANKTAIAYNTKWLDSASGGYAGSQTATAMALALRVAPDAPKSVEWLAQSIGRSGNHSLCGEIGWPYVVRSLSSGRDDLLSAITSRMDAPSYGYQLAQGATTLTESWVADPHLSWNHAMDGHVDAWFYSHVAGIRSVNPLVLSPEPLPGMQHARASRTAKSGIIFLHWEVVVSNFRVNITLPPGMTALVTLPADISDVRESSRTIAQSEFVQALSGTSGSTRLRVPSGSYYFEMPLRHETAELIVV